MGPVAVMFEATRAELARVIRTRSVRLGSEDQTRQAFGDGQFPKAWRDRLRMRHADGIAPPGPEVVATQVPDRRPPGPRRNSWGTAACRHRDGNGLPVGEDRDGPSTRRG